MREKCECAVDWRLNAMQVLLFFFLLTPEKGDEFVMLLRKPLSIAKVFYLALTLSYLSDVEKKDCACAHTTPFRVLFWVTCVQIAIFGGSLGLTIYRKASSRRGGGFAALP